MSIASYILGIAVASGTLLAVIDMLRRGRLRERHAVWWLVGATLGLVVGIFPALLEGAAHLLGIDVPTNLVFFVSIAVLFLVSIQHSTELTRAEERNRRLAETVAIMDMRLTTLERRDPPGSAQPGSHVSPLGPEA
ncbi:hypothetical protein MTE01_03360 [Microbacterium testaceum]|uniref:DUF2304 domain-containing protein n=1 Tax=Microbacterium testaceum TaxID=2033 RepID=A0A4Y3QGQ3_MICTE|nr:DUF2304 domain-containing protein [Microbacterium testaceum]GEB44391.1 hypothetical protein MTE01_03360 [Microbacterium testaceum]